MQRKTKQVLGLAAVSIGTGLYAAWAAVVFKNVGETAIFGTASLLTAGMAVDKFCQPKVQTQDLD